MARFTFKLPDIGEGIAEAEIVAWHVAIGDRVEEDQNIADMMTDKATVEMESPVSGTVVELAGEVGDQVAIGAALVVIETDAASGADELTPVVEDEAKVERVEAQYEAENPGVEETVEPKPAKAEPVAAEPVAASPTGAPAQAGAESPGGGTAGLPPSREHKEEGRAVLASPAVRQRAKELGVDLSQVKPDAEGRIRHADLDTYLRYSAGQGYHSPGGAAPRPDEQVRVIGVRRRIAENMAAAKRNIPHFTYVDEIDVTELERVRADLNASRGDRPKLTLLPFIIAAICKSVPQFPMLNARYDDEAGVVTRSGAVHLGMATQTDAGLMVPVIRHAEQKNVWQLATEITRLAEAARTGKATSQELSGGTLTITSLGPLGGIATTPVINRPEVAIIGPNKVVERPVFHGDEIVRAKLMNLSISCDHRVVDGWDAASYVQALKKLLETPVLLFAPD